MLVLPSLLLAAASLSPLAAGAPSTSVSPSLRSSVSQLSPSARRELAQTIAVHLFARDATDQVDPSVLHDEVVLFLQDLEAQGAKTKLNSFSSPPGSSSKPSLTESDMERRLFGLGEDNNDNEGVLTGYAPAKVACPSGQSFIRVARNISSAESAHVQTRLNPSRFLTYLDGLNLTPADLNLNLNASSPTSAVPNVAMAFSGGGYRAMISGGGQLWGTDSRNEEAVAAGTGGIGAITSYFAGLSGGSWLLGSYYANSNRSIPDLASNIWNLSSNLVVPDVSGFLGTTSYFADLVKEVAEKNQQNFSTQITDYWSLALSAHLFPAQYGPQQTPNLTLSALKGLRAEDVPYPIVIAVEREEDTIVVSENATVWEFSYDEFGTWGFGGGGGGEDSKIVGAFTKMEYMGTTLENGEPSAEGDDKCIVGFDNLGFVVGTSSTLFNSAYATLAKEDAPGILASAIEAVLGAIGSASNDVATYPNPFYKYGSETNNPTTNMASIALVDAGETNQNIPFEPLLIPARGVDAILAFDNSADTTYSWPNGSALWTTYQRFDALAASLSHPPFMPRIPTTNQFVRDGLNTRPVFFGCGTDARPNTTTPLVIYVPNRPWSTASNTSTYQLQYETQQALDIISNSARTLTLNNTLPAGNWSTCLACAFADRAVARGGKERSQKCRDCFQQWCWDGEFDDTAPSGEYEPVVGALPEFLKNLGATATSAAAPQASQTGTSGATSTGGAERRAGGAGVWTMMGAGVIGAGVVAMGVMW